jgi:sugar/nucleoside kinase (ribokinase family)
MGQVRGAVRFAPLLVQGGILIDDLAFSDGRVLDGVLGGAALHALAGAAVWDDDVLLVGGVGEDAENNILPWMRRARLSTVGLRIAGDFTPRNILAYRADGSRTETPAFGPDHFARLQPGAADLVSRMAVARGAYVFRDANLAFWTPVLQAARRARITLLWEISAESCTPACRVDIGAVAGQIAGLSLNLEEATAIFGDKPREALIADIRSLGAEVAFLRCGAEGSIVISAQDAVPVPAYPALVVDVTGAGNAYGGGALAGLVGGGDPVRAGRMGAIAARLTVGQYGLFSPRDETVRVYARAALSNRVS